MRGRIIIAYVLAGLLIVGLAVFSIRGCVEIVGALGINGSTPAAAEIDRLMAEGDAIIAQIEAYRNEHGAYPGSLGEAGIVVPEAGFGGWKYQRQREGGFSLGIGDYSKEHPFALFKVNGADWYLDQ